MKRHLLLIIGTIVIVTQGFLAKKKEKKTDVISEEALMRRRDNRDEVEDGQQVVADPEADGDPHGRLAQWIKSTARKHIPLKYPSKKMDVYVSAGLYQIVDLDQRNNLATVSAYFDVFWQDDFLRWIPDEYGGIERIFVPIKWIWKPEFYMYHSVYGRVPDYAADASVEISNKGRVRMFVSISSKSFCPINFKRFPFDSQKCSFSCGSWAYQSNIVNLIAAKEDIALEDFYDNQEWLLVDAKLSNGTTRNVTSSNESFSMVQMELSLKRQSFYYVFNLVFPTTLVSLVAVIGFHAPINATGRRESKFRLGIMTLLSMSVMLLMLVGEMKFAMESVPGQRGSFSDVPLLGIYYMTLIFIISVSTCTSSIFVHLEKYALRNPSWQAVPWYLQWLAAKKLFCCYVPVAFRYEKDAVRSNNNNIQAISLTSTPDRNVMRNLIPREVNFTEVNQDAPLHDITILEGNPSREQQRLDVIVSLIREMISIKSATCQSLHMTSFWERIVRRLENISLSIYLLIIALNLFMFLYPELWY